MGWYGVFLNVLNSSSDVCVILSRIMLSLAVVQLVSCVICVDVTQISIVDIIIMYCI